jgi:hypothetical protein
VVDVLEFGVANLDALELDKVFRDAVFDGGG